MCPPSIIALMMEAASTSETLVTFNPEDSHLHTRRRENLKSYKFEYVLFFTTVIRVATCLPQIFTVNFWCQDICERAVGTAVPPHLKTGNGRNAAGGNVIDTTL
jgi:hypothetical protein